MNSFLKFNRSGQTIKEYDGEESSGDGEDNGDAESDESDAGAVVPSKSPATANHLLMMALLEHLCTLYVPEVKQSKRLFKVLCQQLANMKIMNPLGSVDEFSSVRSQYRVSFSKLLQAAMGSLAQEKSEGKVEERARIFFQPRHKKQPVLSLSDIISFHTSRYRDEYDELGKLGSGAYGSVYRVLHKLDKLQYAIKKIAFQGDSPDLWFKALREVQYLATLTHNNIIRYHGAWLEYQHPFLPITEESNEIDEEDSPVGAICYDASPSKTKAVVPYVREKSFESSIIFKDDSENSHNPPYMPNLDDSLTDSSIEFDSSPKQNCADEEHEFYGRSFVVLHIQMELCGVTLSDWLKRRNLKVNYKTGTHLSMNEQEVLRILRELLEGVNHIHSCDFIHRDLKPKNIFVNDDENELHIKIGDFGLARKTNSMKNSEQPEPPLTPHPGQRGPHFADGTDVLLTEGVGTTIYAAPEQLKGGDYDVKCDMFSLGLVILELYQPFKTEMERIHTLTDARKGILPVEFYEFWPQMAAVVKSLISFDPEERPTPREILNSSIFKTPEQITIDLHEKIKTQCSKIEELEQTASMVPNLQSTISDLNADITKKNLVIAQQRDEILILKKALQTSINS